MTEKKKLPRVVIVGRPNVGKSTLLNRMCHSRISIVEPTAGVTRDRIAVPARIPTHWGERVIEVIDTGGIGIVDRDDLGPRVEEQVRSALEFADLVLFVVDVRSGITPLDRDVAKRLRGQEVPMLLVVNKVEGDKLTWDVDEFHALGLVDEVHPISAQNGEGMGDLFNAIGQALPAHTPDEVLPRPTMKIAVVGRRNAGKSTLVNAIAREDRVIVSEIPGTTRDAIDVIVERDGEVFVMIDTAGVRKRKSHEDAIEFYSDARSHKAIRRADVVLLMFDSTENLSAIEKKLARYVKDHHKPVILVPNKWDLVQGLEPDDYRKYLEQELPGLIWAPVSFMSAKTKENVQGTMDLVGEIYRAAGQRVGTGELNRVLERALNARSPNKRGHRVRIKYATQAGVYPPTFVLFVNDKTLVGKDYLRYLENRIRADLPFAEVPFQIVLRDSKEVPIAEL